MLDQWFWFAQLCIVIHLLVPIYGLITLKICAIIGYMALLLEELYQEEPTGLFLTV